MKTKLLYIVFFLMTLHIAGQERKSLKGTVTSSNNSVHLADVFVINKNTGLETKTDSKGNFTISARNGDKLTVFSIKTKEQEFFISNDSFKNMPYVLAVEVNATELDEVVVTDTVAIVQPVEGVAAYTPAERRLNVATKVKPHTMPTTWQNGGGIAIPLDALWNGSKKRRALRRELKTEQIQRNIDGIGTIYTKEEITEVLAIPAEGVEGFIYFAAEDAELEKALKENSRDKATFRLSVLAADFITRQQEPAQTEPVKE